METVNFRRMADGTAEEYACLAPLRGKIREQLPDTLLRLLKRMRGDRLGYRVDRYAHSLQTATRAARDGADEETLVCALLHDVGDLLAPDNHSEVIAAILRPFVSERNHWVLKHHGLFQGYYYFHHRGGDRNVRDRHLGHPHHQACVDFCQRWDQESFDPNYDTLPLEHFEPLVWRVLAAPRDIYA